VVLAWFVLASASVGAAPCFAMTLSATPAEHHGGTVRATVAHDHSHAAAHDDSAPSEQPDRPTPCKHCPLSVAMAGSGSTSSHAFCSAADDVSDGGKPSVPPIAFKTILSVPIVELLPFDQGPSLTREKQRQPDAATTSIALNLRHCVFLI
jgi:hypothetical protein